MCRGKPPEKAPGKLCSKKTREAELSRVEGYIAGAAEEGKPGSQPGSLTAWKLQGWPPCFTSLVQRWVQFEVEKLRGDRGSRGICDCVGSQCSVRVGAVWCLVPCGDGEVRGQFSSGALLSLLPHKARWLSTSVSPEKISFDRDFKGFSNLGKSTSALLCSRESHSLLGRSLGERGGAPERGDF